MSAMEVDGAGPDPEDFPGCAYNEKLPYADQIKYENLELLAEIKEGLVAGVKCRELTPGATFWFRRLNEFLLLHKHNIPRDELVGMCKLLFELLIMPGIDLNLQEKFARVLTKLIRKEYVLPAECLELPWRPLYEIMDRVYFPSTRSCVYVRRDRHGDAMWRLIDCARRFFPSSATEEILQQFRPLLCPHDTSIFKAQGFLALFLPTAAKKGEPTMHHLWLDEVMSMWPWAENMPSWDLQWMSLLERLAADNVGQIDWEPYFPQLFTKFLRVLQLPVGSSAPPLPYQHKMPAQCQVLLPEGDRSLQQVAKLSSLIVSFIVPNGKGLDFLASLVRAIEGFYHPSNSGHWTTRLAAFMNYLCSEYAGRLAEEREKRCTIPTEARLTNAETRAFVEILMPILLMALYAKSSHMVMGAAEALKTLAYLAPDMVFPDLLERAYPALETLTETHQTIATLGCLSYVARPLLWRQHYPEGALHLANLLQLSLPGIDPNDPIKTEATFKFYCSVLTCVPMIDSSNLPSSVSLPEREVQICESTAIFEEWVLQVLDRIFLVCEHLVEPAKRGKRSAASAVEANFSSSVRGTCRLLFTQMSPSILQEATERVFRYVTSHLLVKAMKPIGHVCAAASFANPELSLRRFVPFLSDRIIDTAQSHMGEEEADSELLWDLHILAQVVRQTGAALLPYSDTLLQVLSHTVWSSSRPITKLGGKLLRNILRTLTSIYPRNLRSVSQEDWENDSWTPTEHWGEAYDLDALEVDWHVPSSEELQFAYKLLETFLGPAMATIQRIVQRSPTANGDAEGKASSADQSRYDLWQCLIVIKNIRVSLGPYLESAVEVRCADSEWDAMVSQHADRKSIVLMPKRPLIVAPPCPQDSTGMDADVHYDVARLLHTLCEHMLSQREDDAKLLRLMIKTYSAALCNGAKDSTIIYSKKRMYSTSKVVLSDGLVKRRHPRMLQVMRVDIQQQTRVNRNNMAVKYTPVHYNLILDLLRLSTNAYADVRKKAQSALSSALRVFPGAKYDMFPLVLEYLDPQYALHNDESVKGAVYTLQSRSLLHLVCHSWDHMTSFITSMCKLQAVDKQSVQALVSKLFIHFSLEYYTLAIKLEISPTALQAADALGCDSFTKARVAEGVQRAEERNEDSAVAYHRLNAELVGLLNEGKLHWRYELMVSSCLIFLLRPDVPTPEGVVRWFLRGAVSELAPLRKISFKALESILVLMKRPPTNKKEMDLSHETTPHPPEVYGQREANRSMLYIDANLPRTAEAWSQCQFVEKNYIGWNVFPAQTPVFTGSGPPVSEEGMSTSERAVYELFTSPDFVAQLIKYLDQEANSQDVEYVQQRGPNDGFNDINAQMFKGVFRNCGIRAFEVLKPHLVTLCASTDRHSQRTASEIVGGFARGCKLWPFEHIQACWEFLEPMLAKTFVALSNEATSDWSSCIRFCSYDRDARRLVWLGQLLLRLPDPADPEVSTATEARLLTFYQIIIGELSWRSVDASRALLAHIHSNASHPYKLVRERMARGLYVVFRNFWQPTDIQGLDAEGRHGGEAFVVDIIKRAMQPSTSPEDDEAKLCSKTVLNWLTITFHSGGSLSILPYFHHLLAPLFRMVDNGNEEIVNLAKQSLGFISQTTFPARKIPVVLDALVEAASTCKWHGKVMVLNFLQVMAFRNLFLLDAASNNRITELLLLLLVDEQLEVRQLAGVTIGGLLRCNARLDAAVLQRKFQELARTKAVREKGQAVAKNPAFVRRHAGVLGLAAFIGAHPYDVPAFMPEMLCELGDHINDPVPIQTTVKQTLSEFWRTHQDNWQGFKPLFTEDQLLTLTDLLISPSYYA